ncbi:Gmad2 immunoglobulin-like domain-containing protein [Nocardioides aquiterrae]|uniref:GerMN domain-containing protein n=1 Tax=Nocardioides aquiterrae TaxID=203799 RepID=A0ABN1UJY3_9ACTN
MNLADVLHDAVDGIDPADRIDAIRARTASAPARGGRPWFYAAGAVVLATAATVAAFAVLDDSTRSSGPTHHDDQVTSVPTPGTQLVPAYFIGDTPRGPRLFREFDRVVGPDAVQAALDRIQRPPADHDYTTGWAPGSFGDATVRDGRIDVELSDGVDLSDRLAVQQAVYTLQGAAGQRLPVYFWLEGQRGNMGEVADPAVLSQVMINDPTEGLEVHDYFTARGAANSYEANVPWELRDDSGSVVRRGFATTPGWGDRLYPWEARVDVRDLPFGSYTFVAMTDDPSGGEGGGPDADTRTIIVR